MGYSQCYSTYNVSSTNSLANSGQCSGSAFVLFMTIVETLLVNSRRVNDPCNRITPITAPSAEYDFIVVGGGSSGSVVAARLAEVAEENDWTILLVEAGPDEPAFSQVPFFFSLSERTPISWNFSTETEANACGVLNGKCFWPKGKVLGGSGVLNAMMYVRATEADANRWVAAGNTNWDYDELLRLYMKSEDNRNETLVESGYHAEGGLWTIQNFNYEYPTTEVLLTGYEEAGFTYSDDLNGEVNHGYARYQANNINGTRMSTAKAFLRPQRNNSYLHIMLNSTVSKLIIDNSTDDLTATGVQIIYNNATYQVNVTKEIILTAGSVQTPQILMLSGIGDSTELTKHGIDVVLNLTAVGKGLKDHPQFYMLYNTTNNSTLYSWDTITEYLETEGGPLSANIVHDVMAKFNSSYSTEDDPDGELMTEIMPTWCNSSVKEFLFINPILNQPRSSGNVSLNSSDIFDHPKMYANYYTNETDMKAMLDFVRLSQKLAAAPTIKASLGVDQIYESYYGNCSSLYESDSDDWWECAIKYRTNSVYHPACSCKMGLEDNEEACVNQDLQLYGISNIRIADASVFPDMVSGNIHATVVAIAEKASEMIIDTYASD